MRSIMTVFANIIYSHRLFFKFCKFTSFVQIFLKLILGILPVGMVWVSQELINEITNFTSNKSSFSWILVLFILQAVMLFATFGFQQLSTLINKKIEIQFELKISEITYNKISRIPYLFFETSSFQDKLYRAKMSKTQMLKLTNDSLEFVRCLITWTSILLYLVAFSWYFIPIMVIGSLPIVIMQLKFGSKRFHLMKYLTSFNRKAYYIDELLTRRENLKEVRLFGNENFLLGEWKKNYLKDSEENYHFLKSQSLWLTLTQIFFISTYIVSGILTLFLLKSHLIVIGSFVAILQAIQRMQGVVNTFSYSLSGIAESSLQVSEFKSLLNVSESDNIPASHNVGKISTIDIKKLTFTYPDSAKPSIKNIDLTINPGHKIAIVGSNGSGKSTLIKCLTGLYETKNAIRINNIPLENINIRTYQDRLSVLFQDYIKYEFSVKDNILLGNAKGKANEQEVVTAASKVNMHSHILNLPQQYETQLGRLFEQGQDLSGGQWQRIAIARTLFRNSDMVILDEPTAALDSKSEAQILKNLFQVSQEQIIIFITHRLEAAKLADEIIVMKDGIIVERGNHIELLRKDGEYRSLYESQKMNKSIIDNVEKGVS